MKSLRAACIVALFAGLAARASAQSATLFTSPASPVTYGQQLTLLSYLLNITFKSPFAGNRVVWVAGRDQASGNNTDWQSVGTTTVQ